MSQNRRDEIAELRRRLEELEAQERTQPTEAPPPGPAQAATVPQQDRTALFGVAALVIILLGTLAYCSSQSSPGTAPGAEGGPTAIQQEIAASVADKPMEAVPPEPRNWSYRETVDPMTDRKTQFACVNSTNEVRLYPPYSDVKAELCIRHSPRYGLDAFVQLLGDGQIICRSYDNCTVKVRFGDGAQQSFSAVDGADGSSNIVFITNASRFVTGAKTADITRVQMTFYEAGDQVIEFDTKGLEWPRPAG
jgi:hypothetical protein